MQHPSGIGTLTLNAVFLQILYGRNDLQLQSASLILSAASLGVVCQFATQSGLLQGEQPDVGLTGRCLKGGETDQTKQINRDPKIVQEERKTVEEGRKEGRKEERKEGRKEGRKKFFGPLIL